MAFIVIVMMGVFLEPVTDFVAIGVAGTNSTLVQTIVNLFPVLFVIGAVALILKLMTGERQPMYGGM